MLLVIGVDPDRLARRLPARSRSCSSSRSARSCCSWSSPSSRRSRRPRSRTRPRSSTSFGTFPSEIQLAILVGALAAAGAGGANNLVQSNWIRDKGFGMGTLRAAHRLPDHRPGGGRDRRRRAATRSRPTRPNLARWRAVVEAREPRAVRVLRVHRDDHASSSSRCSPTRPSSRTRTCRTRAASTSSRSRPPCSTARSATGSARCSSPSARSRCSPPRSASSTTSRAWSPTSSTPATRAAAAAGRRVAPVLRASCGR